MGWGQRAHKRKNHTNTERVRKEESEMGTGERNSQKCGGKGAAEEEESQVGAWSEEQSVFLQEKISAIHVDPEALIQGGEGKWWVRAFNNEFLPADPQMPQPERPGKGLGSGVP